MKNCFIRTGKEAIMDTEKRTGRDDFVADFWKRMGYVFGMGGAFVPGMVAGLEIIAKEMEKDAKKQG